jgi:uncharacterized membrane protein YkoI
MGVEQVSQRLQAAGYVVVGEIELDDGVYEIDVRDAAGRTLEAHVDAFSGEILSPLQPGQIVLTADEVRARVALVGYTDVRDLERDDGYWNVEVRDGNGVERELRVHPFSGAIVSEQFDD